MSSEALEAIRRRNAAAVSGPWDTSRGTLSDYITQSRLDVLALLAEVARLEQEADFHAHSYDEWRERAKTAEAALAVAREREQHAVGALEKIECLPQYARIGTARHIARATLAEPEGVTGPVEASAIRQSPVSGSASAAADAMEARAAALDAYGESLPDGVTTEAFAEAANLRREARRLRASAAADEPRLLVGKHPKTGEGATFALDAEARCACGDLIDDHPTMACGFPRAPAADEPGETPA